MVLKQVTVCLVLQVLRVYITTPHFLYIWIIYFVIGGLNCIRMNLMLTITLIVSSFGASLAIWCYQCTSATPGCTTPFNWRGVGYLGSPCPDNDDICIKLIERKGAQEVITRDCLSNFRAFRTDIPADTYEGCRTAAKDLNLAHYVNNSIKELDIKRDWYDETIWCFCFLDHRCNGASNVLSSMALLIASWSVLFLAKITLF